MKLLSSLLGLMIMLSATAGDDIKANFKKGNPGIKSINALSFGPEGVLFIGDSENAKIFAYDTEDLEPVDKKEDFSIENFDVKIADMLGATTDEIEIVDLVVNPVSKNLYAAVTHTSGKNVLVKITDNENMSVVDLSDISYDDQSLSDAVSADAKDRRGRPMRKWAISDLNYANGLVMVTGLSNKEFGSSFRSMPFPFEDDQKLSTLEIYHAAHGQYETQSPVKTFTNAKIADKDYVVAGYTCTPLVIFPANDLVPGKHVKGRTVAELGNWNTPLDMIVMEKEGKSYLLLANSSRAVMKIKLDDVADFNGSLTEPIEERGGTAGVDFIALPFTNVQQLDKLDAERFVMLQRRGDGELRLWTSNNRWL